MIEVMATREAYNGNEILNVGLVSPTKYNSMYKILVKGKDCTTVTQWIYRLG